MQASMELLLLLVPAGSVCIKGHGRPVLSDLDSHIRHPPGYCRGKIRDINVLAREFFLVCHGEG